MLETERLSTIIEAPTRTLIDVARIDYFATNKLIRQIFIPDFDSNKFDSEIKDAYKWMTDRRSGIESLFGSKLPDYVKNNRFTLGLYVELANEINSRDAKFLKPVAFGLATKSLKEDVECLKDEVLKNGDGYALLDPDTLSFVVFIKYWHVLNSRAKLLEK